MAWVHMGLHCGIHMQEIMYTAEGPGAESCRHFSGLFEHCLGSTKVTNDFLRIWISHKISWKYHSSSIYGIARYFRKSNITCCLYVRHHAINIFLTYVAYLVKYLLFKLRKCLDKTKKNMWVREITWPHAVIALSKHSMPEPQWGSAHSCTPVWMDFL